MACLQLQHELLFGRAKSVATNPARSRLEQRPIQVSSALVAEYKRAHQEVIAALQTMDEMGLEAPGSLLKLSHTRLRITRAANESRTSLQKILAILSQVPSPTIARKVELLEQLHAQVRDAARRHMAAWPHAAAQADWQTYLQSHTQVAQLWREVIARERQFLYPIL